MIELALTILCCLVVFAHFAAYIFAKSMARQHRHLDNIDRRNGRHE